MRFSVVFKELDRNIPVSFRELDSYFQVEFKSFQTTNAAPDIEYYKGDYAVTPKVTAQTLPTAQKTMGEDLTVLAIPFYNVSNNSGGKTIYIAREV